MARVSYFGMGPMESYCDKHHAASHDYFSSTIWQQHEDYIRPQENGSHYDCDYVQLDGAGIKLTAVGAKPFCFNASHYTQEELTEKRTTMSCIPVTAPFSALTMHRTASALPAAGRVWRSSTALTTLPSISASV